MSYDIKTQESKLDCRRALSGWAICRTASPAVIMYRSQDLMSASVCVLVVIHCFRGCILVNALSLYYLGNCAIQEIFLFFICVMCHTRLRNKWITAEILERKEKWTKRSRRAIKCLKKLSAADQCLPATLSLWEHSRVCVCVCLHAQTSVFFTELQHTEDQQPPLQGTKSTHKGVN